MAEAKDEAGGRALEFLEFEMHGHRWTLHRTAPNCLPFVASASDVTAALLANPEARMAVLAALGHVESVEERIASRLTERRDALAFGIAVLREKVRVRSLSSTEAIVDALEELRLEALSAPTAESGKDSSPSPEDQCSECEAHVTECRARRARTGNACCGTCNHEPAPVAEAPERGAQTVGGRDYMEQLELEVAELKEELAGLNAADRVSRVALSGLVEDRDRLRTQLTDANLKAEGLRGDLGEAQREVAVRLDHLEEWQAWAAELCSPPVDTGAEAQRKHISAQLTAAERKAEGLRVENEELKDQLQEAKDMCALTLDANLATGKQLAESERKLDRYRRFVCDVQERIDTDCPKPERLFSIREALAEFRRDTTEPAGVEAGKTDPTPTETEAPARFWVGQRVRWIPSGRVFRIEPDQLEVVMSNPHNYELVRAKKPVDPAPPKPGGEVLTRAELVDALRKVQALDCLPAAAISTVRLVADGLEAGSNV